MGDLGRPRITPTINLRSLEEVPLEGIITETIEAIRAMSLSSNSMMEAVRELIPMNR